MNLYRARYILYIAAAVGVFSILFMSLATDFTVNNPFLSKILVGIPFIFVIIGKFLSIAEKKKNNMDAHKDWGLNIGLIIAMILYLI